MESWLLAILSIVGDEHLSHAVLRFGRDLRFRTLSSLRTPLVYLKFLGGFWGLLHSLEHLSNKLKRLRQ